MPLPIIKKPNHPEILKVVERIAYIRASLKSGDPKESDIAALLNEMAEVNKEDSNLAYIMGTCDIILKPCTDFTFGALMMYQLLREQDIINQCAELESLIR